MENKPVFVLLAGGQSSRMGVPKGLLVYKNSFWLLEQFNRISKTEVSTVYLGLGFDVERYFEAIPWLKTATETPFLYLSLKIKVVCNPEPAQGSFATLQSVLSQISPEKSVLIQPIDCPILNSFELKKIINTTNTIVLPNFEGKNGHPIKAIPGFWKLLLNLDLNDKNSRLDFQIKVLPSQDKTIVAVTDLSIVQNLNTPQNWSSFVENKAHDL